MQGATLERIPIVFSSGEENSFLECILRSCLLEGYACGEDLLQKTPLRTPRWH